MVDLEGDGLFREEKQNALKEFLRTLLKQTLRIERASVPRWIPSTLLP